MARGKDTVRRRSRADGERLVARFVTAGLGWILGKGITGRSVAPSSRRQEAAQRFAKNTATVTGGLWDAASWWAPDLAPQMHYCVSR
jgi:hypothetical protein